MEMMWNTWSTFISYPTKSPLPKLHLRKVAALYGTHQVRVRLQPHFAQHLGHDQIIGLRQINLLLVIGVIVEYYKRTNGQH